MRRPRPKRATTLSRRLTFGQITDGGSGEVLDLASGLIITNGGKTVTLDTSNVHTVEDLLNLINGADLGLVAEINATRNGINVRSRLNGADLTIGENGGTLATQLGIRTYTADSKLADFNRGFGVPTARRSDGQRRADHRPRRDAARAQSVHGEDRSGCD